MSLEQNFPLTNGPIVNADGTPTLSFLAWMRTLWGRTGYAPGVSADDLLLLAVIGQQDSGDPAARTQAESAELLALERPTTRPDLTQALLFALANQRPAARPPTQGKVLTASEAIAGGDLTNVYLTGGNMRVRKADASDPTRFCNSFAPGGIGNAASGLVEFTGFNAAVTVGTGASEAWLSDATPGAYTLTAPTTAGHILQTVGTPVQGQGLAFLPGPYILL